jgi:hypothetical protein
LRSLPRRSMNFASLPGGKRSMVDFLRFVREIQDHMSPGKNKRVAGL